MFFYPTPCVDDQILVAAKIGDLKLLRELRNKAGGDVAFRLKCEFIAEVEGLTCLHLAAERGNVEMCRFLIEQVKLNIDFKTDKGQSPLLLAAFNGQFRLAQYFIIQGADVKLSNHQGITCLHIAAENGNMQIMQLLLSKGADIEAHSLSGTPLQRAAANVESVRFLLSRGANPNVFSPLSFSPLMVAIACCSYESVELLLEAGADPNEHSCGLSPLAMAAKGKNGAQFLSSLIEAGANPNTPTIDLMLPIECAAEVGNTEGMTVLFPVTKRNSRYPDWSVCGIETRFRSDQAKAQRKEWRGRFIRKLDEEGKNAAKRKDYSEAVVMFSGAILLEPANVRLLLNRSLCWANLNEPNFALHDAEASIKLKPNRPKAHYRAGAAWMLLKNYFKACASFKRASTLDPHNMEIKKALSLALKPVILGYAERDLMQTVIILALIVPFCEPFYENLRDLAKKDPTKAMQVLRKYLDSPGLPGLM